MLQCSSKANWSIPISVLSSVKDSRLQTSLSNSLMIMFVRDIGRSWAHDDNGDSLGIGDMLVSFHGRGTDCCLSE